MLRPSRSALLATTASLAIGLLAAPGAAYATDTTTSLSREQMVDELGTVAKASTLAAEKGWKANIVLTDLTIDADLTGWKANVADVGRKAAVASTGEVGAPGSGAAAVTDTGEMSMSMFYVVDPVRGRTLERYRYGTTTAGAYSAQGRGRYQSLSDPTTRSVLKMMRRPQVRYVFTPNPSQDFDEAVPAPATVLTEDIQAGTKTVHGDGSADYTFRPEDDTNVTLRVNSAGTLTRAQAGQENSAISLTYAYGPQHVTLPSRSATISWAELTKGMAYLDMRTYVASAANQGATETLRAAAGRTVKVASVREHVRQEAAVWNSYASTRMIKAKDIRGGIRVHATNPWTHKTVSYTVKASGKKITVRG
ncbi:hypothetical protein GCM10010112_90840 [Actinoplanes lobatus]|uniref:Uncharacterized protein n=1 Tax=Actinoplanes lobatus TaxID=113568 RepID=A0A7W7HLA8_9ACTN|nr:hypothetical protein [Actinoplanes lobatus]MBB4752591.1 hypothetical protein [Actinoplanes lobatus]GGN98077.1 hypothetical protein GCM10010112_90840 [Actinoplanes lobatus]GIE45869.1 hypothetical protein Alo02nite_87670 [Actinoplanes lobatus]